MKKFMAVTVAAAVLALPALAVTAPSSVAADEPGAFGGPVLAASVPSFLTLGAVPALVMTKSESQRVRGAGDQLGGGGGLVSFNRTRALALPGGNMR